jgi:hypothetical protein
LSDDSSAFVEGDSRNPPEEKVETDHDARRAKEEKGRASKHELWKLEQVRLKHKRRREKFWMLLGRQLDLTREQMFWDDKLGRYLAPQETAWSWFKLCYDQAVKEADLWWDSKRNNK